MGGRVAKSDVSPQRTLLSVCGVQEVKLEPSGVVGRGGDAVTPISRHYIYVPPNRVQCIFFLPLAHPLSVEKRYMHSLLKFDSGTGLVFSPFLSRLNEFQGKY